MPLTPEEKEKWLKQNFPLDRARSGSTAGSAAKDGDEPVAQPHAVEPDPVYEDIEGLELICEGLEKTSPRMRRASLEFAWDKYVTRAPKTQVNEGS